VSVVILAYGDDGTFMACDTLVSTDESKFASGDKIHQFGRATVGICGDVSVEWEILRSPPKLGRGDPFGWLANKLVPHARKALRRTCEHLGREHLDTSLLVYADGRAWMMGSPDMVPCFVADWHAEIGCGAPFAAGALNLYGRLPESAQSRISTERLLRLAIEATEDACPFVGGAPVVMRVA
jgi:hypothetical protein